MQRLLRSVLAGIALLLLQAKIAALTPPFQRAPYTIDLLGISAQRDSGGSFRIPSRGMSHLIVWVGPGARLIMDFSTPFADGPGSDFAILTSQESWGPVEPATATFEFWLNDLLVGSLTTDRLRPGELFTFELPGEDVIANRIILLNTTPGSPAGATLAFVDAGVAFTIAPVSTNSVLSRQAGLLLERIRITNDTPTPLPTIRVWVRLDTNSVAQGVRVWNAAGSSNNVPFFFLKQPLEAGQSVDLVAEYYVPDRSTIPSALYLTEVIPAEPAPVPEGTTLAVDRVLWLDSNEVLVEFSTIAEQEYFLQYSVDLAAWKTALPAVTGTGGRVQWIDHGPPKTESLPSNGSTRFYRLLSVRSH